MKIILYLICTIISFLFIGTITYFAWGYFLPDLELIFFRSVLSLILGYGLYKYLNKGIIFILIGLSTPIFSQTDKDIQQAVFEAEKANISSITLEGYYKIENPILITKSLRIKGKRLILDCGGSMINCVVFEPWVVDGWNFTFSRVFITPSIENSKAEITVKIDEVEKTVQKVLLFILK